MTTTLTQTFNRDDIRRVYASFAADYTIVAEWTGLHDPARVTRNIAAVKALAEEQYMSDVHLHLRASNAAIREAAVYRVSTNASAWSSDRPGDLYWDTYAGDYLALTVFYSPMWAALSQAAKDAFRALHLPGWGPSDFDGNYGTMVGAADRRYSSRAYGLERTRYSS
jgi:hypothetical protein